MSIYDYLDRKLATKRILRGWHDRAYARDHNRDKIEYIRAKLTTKRFLISFDSGVVVIKHWRIHNIIRSDRHKDTNYTEEMQMLTVKENGAYSLCQPNDNQLTANCQPTDNQLTTNCQPNDNQLTTNCQRSIGKVSIDKVSQVESKTAKRFIPPTIKEVADYCFERKNGIDPQHFVDYYTARGWELKPGQKVKDWKACVRTWEQRTPKPQETPKRSSVTEEDNERIRRFLEK